MSAKAPEKPDLCMETNELFRLRDCLRELSSGQRESKHDNSTIYPARTTVVISRKEMMKRAGAIANKINAIADAIVAKTD